MVQFARGATLVLLAFPVVAMHATASPASLLSLLQPAISASEDPQPRSFNLLGLFLPPDETARVQPAPQLVPNAIRNTAAQAITSVITNAPAVVINAHADVAQAASTLVMGLGANLVDPVVAGKTTSTPASPSTNALPPITPPLRDDTVKDTVGDVSESITPGTTRVPSANSSPIVQAPTSTAPQMSEMLTKSLLPGTVIPFIPFASSEVPETTAPVSTSNPVLPTTPTAVDLQSPAPALPTVEATPEPATRAPTAQRLPAPTPTVAQTSAPTLTPIPTPTVAAPEPPATTQPPPILPPTDVPTPISTPPPIEMPSQPPPLTTQPMPTPTPIPETAAPTLAPSPAPTIAPTSAPATQTPTVAPTSTLAPLPTLAPAPAPAPAPTISPIATPAPPLLTPPPTSAPVPPAPAVASPLIPQIVIDAIPQIVVDVQIPAVTPTPTAANAPPPQPTAKQKRDVYLTGFGKFAGVDDNPTQRIVEHIASDAAVTEARVLEVSAAGTECFVFSLLSSPSLLALIRNDGLVITGSLEMITPMRAKAKDKGRPMVFLHLGVVPLASDFTLELVGYNLANFATPDERGRTATNEVIDPKEGPSLRTSLPLDQLRAQLAQVNPKVHVSTEPGRFICNWVYFHSLQWVKQQQAAVEASNFATLVLHVPPFAGISMADQVRFVRRLIDLLANL